jgi:hypothetical protein
VCIKAAREGVMLDIHRTILHHGQMHQDSVCRWVIDVKADNALGKACFTCTNFTRPIAACDDSKKDIAVGLFTNFVGI